MSLLSKRMVAEPGPASLEGRLESYRRLADVFHHVLSEHSLDALLERVADALAELIPYDSLTVWQAHETERVLLPVLARDQWAEEIMKDRVIFGEGLTGRAVESGTALLANDAHLDDSAVTIPGTPEAEPESIIIVPLRAGGTSQGALNIYRLGYGAHFSADDFELAKRFGDAAALAFDNAQTRERLEMLAHTDSLTGLYNHRYFYERLRAELTRASRIHDSVTVLMLDIDDFKKLNDIYGHGVGDNVLIALGDMLKQMMRASDVVCRLGGEEFTVIMPSCNAGDALGLAARLQERLADTCFEPAGHITVSMGVAQGPEHAMNPRELVSCADDAMMAAKARGKNRIVLFDEQATERPEAVSGNRDVRSIAHLKLLQSLASKLNRLNNMSEIGTTIANELRTLIDYHNCRVYMRDGDYLFPIAFKGELAAYQDEEEEAEILSCAIGEGITGHAAETGVPLLIGNALDCDFAVDVPGTDDIDESMIAVPLSYGARVIGVIVISKLGVNQFDDDDLRLMEVLSGHASVALENARLYEMQRREAQNAKALLVFADAMAEAPSLQAISTDSVEVAARLLGDSPSSLWLQDDRTGQFRCVAHHGYTDDPDAEPITRMVLTKGDGEAFLRGRKEPFVVSVEDTKRHFGLPADAITRPAAIAPLHGTPGWIAVRQPVPGGHYFSQERLVVLAGVSYQASLAMQKAQLFRAQKESAQIANALLEFGRQVASAEGQDLVLGRIVELSSRMLDSPRASVWLQNPLTRALHAEALSGYSGEFAERMKQTSLKEDAVRSFLTLDEPFVLQRSDLAQIEGVVGLAEARSVAIAPLQLDGGAAGFIVVAAPDEEGFEFSERRMRLLSGIAQQSRLALNNAMSFGNLELTFLSTVEALANALEAKDEYTSSHARWITDMSLEVGRALGLELKALKALELGALFHDIGKIGIPHSILLKAGPLSDEEWEIIRTHPELGEKILAPIDRLAEVRPIVRSCHERFDGLGYPDGKVGDAIPIASRIILVCDAFHAMTTDRPYRDRLPVDVACTRLSADAGTQFDPEVVTTFLRLIRERPELAEGV